MSTSIDVNFHADENVQVTPQVKLHRKAETVWAEIEVCAKDPRVVLGPRAKVLYFGTPEETRAFVCALIASAAQALMDGADEGAWHKLRRRIEGICQECNEEVVDPESTGPRGLLCEDHWAVVDREEADDRKRAERAW